VHDVETLLRTVMRSSTVLRDAQVPFALCGGLAVYARGGVAGQHDVDFVIREVDVDRALAAFDAAQFRTERPEADWLVKAYDGDVLVDLVFRPVDHPVSDATLAATDELAVGAARLPVLSATDLLVHSLLRLTDHECDFSQPLSIARSIREQVDFEQVHEQTAASPYARAFLFLVDELKLVEKVWL